MSSGHELHKLKIEASIRIGCDDVEMFSWPVMFGSTAGPGGGIGGCMMTTFQVYGFRDVASDKGVLYCAGKWKYVKPFKPLMGW